MKQSRHTNAKRQCQKEGTVVYVAVLRHTFMFKRFKVPGITQLAHTSVTHKTKTLSIRRRVSVSEGKENTIAHHHKLPIEL